MRNGKIPEYFSGENGAQKMAFMAEKCLFWVK
jgi:hypothetical protein